MAWRYVLASAVFLRTLLLCSTSAPMDENTYYGTVAAGSVLDFGFKFYKEIIKTQKDNIACSAFVIYGAIGLVLVGTKGATLSQLEGALALENIEMMYMGNKAIYEDLLKSRGDISYMDLVNSIWLAHDIVLEKEYLDKINEWFSFLLQTGGIDEDPTGARNRLNKAIEKETDGRIKDLLPVNSILPPTRLALANAIYFKPNWDVSFETVKMDFRVNDTYTMFVDGLTSENDFSIHLDFDWGVEVLSIPCSDGKFSMIFIQPFMGTLSKFEELADGNAGRSLVINSRDSRNIMRARITFPKFQINHTMNDLVDSLLNMGMTSLFVSKKADFSGLSKSKEVFISSFVHQSIITVDAPMSGNSGVTDDNLIRLVTIDKPFLFYLVDNDFNTAILNGRVKKPIKPVEVPKPSQPGTDDDNGKQDIPDKDLPAMNNDAILISISLITLLCPTITMIWSI